MARSTKRIKRSIQKHNKSRRSRSSRYSKRNKQNNTFIQYIQGGFSKGQLTGLLGYCATAVLNQNTTCKLFFKRKDGVGKGPNYKIEFDTKFGEGFGGMNVYQEKGTAMEFGEESFFISEYDVYVIETTGRKVKVIDVKLAEADGTMAKMSKAATDLYLATEAVVPEVNAAIKGKKPIKQAKTSKDQPGAVTVMFGPKGDVLRDTFDVVAEAPLMGKVGVAAATGFTGLATYSIVSSVFSALYTGALYGSIVVGGGAVVAGGGYLIYKQLNKSKEVKEIEEPQAPATQTEIAQAPVTQTEIAQATTTQAASILNNSQVIETFNERQIEMAKKMIIAKICKDKLSVHTTSPEDTDKIIAACDGTLYINIFVKTGIESAALKTILDNQNAKTLIELSEILIDVEPLSIEGQKKISSIETDLPTSEEVVNEAAVLQTLVENQQTEAQTQPTIQQLARERLERQGRKQMAESTK